MSALARGMKVRVLKKLSSFTLQYKPNNTQKHRSTELTPQNRNRGTLTVGEVSGLDDHALALVIDAHLGAVEHHRAHHVRVDAAVEARNACEREEKRIGKKGTKW